MRAVAQHENALEFICHGENAEVVMGFKEKAEQPDVAGSDLNVDSL